MEPPHSAQVQVKRLVGFIVRGEHNTKANTRHPAFGQFWRRLPLRLRVRHVPQTHRRKHCRHGKRQLPACRNTTRPFSGKGIGAGGKRLWLALGVELGKDLERLHCKGARHLATQLQDVAALVVSEPLLQLSQASRADGRDGSVTDWPRHLPECARSAHPT